MKKSTVEQILVLIKSGGEEALSLKVYLDGTLCRRGCGATPPIQTSCVSHTHSHDLFESLMQRIPQQLLDTPVNHSEPISSGSIEYVMAFYGDSINGQTGEQAQWKQSTGLRFLLDANTSFRHPALAFIDGLASEAVSRTNSWYFDCLILACLKMRSESLPPESLLMLPKTDTEVQGDFRNYLAQTQSLDFQAMTDGKVYVDPEGLKFRLVFQNKNKGGSIRYDFLPVGGVSAMPNLDTSRDPRAMGLQKSQPRKSWWQFWG